MIYKAITQEELKQILKDHNDWLNNAGGKRANLSYANLHSANLHSANLHSADLSYADLRYANLSYADLSSANLSYADLRYANLHSANLHSANLHSANLHSANLSSADLSYADLRYANLLTFQYQQHMAYCTGERLIIGCEDYSLIEWMSNYKEIGKKHNYTDLQIEMYGQFIKMCIEHAATIKEKK